MSVQALFAARKRTEHSPPRYAGGVLWSQHANGIGRAAFNERSKFSTFLLNTSMVSGFCVSLRIILAKSADVITYMNNQFGVTINKKKKNSNINMNLYVLNNQTLDRVMPRY